MKHLTGGAEAPSCLRRTDHSAQALILDHAMEDVSCLPGTNPRHIDSIHSQALLCLLSEQAGALSHHAVCFCCVLSHSVSVGMLTNRTVLLEVQPASCPLVAAIHLSQRHLRITSGSAHSAGSLLEMRRFACRRGSADLRCRMGLYTAKLSDDDGPGVHRCQLMLCLGCARENASESVRAHYQGPQRTQAWCRTPC